MYAIVKRFKYDKKTVTFMIIVIYVLCIQIVNNLNTVLNTILAFLIRYTERFVHITIEGGGCFAIKLN